MILKIKYGSLFGNEQKGIQLRLIDENKNMVDVCFSTPWDKEQQNIEKYTITLIKSLLSAYEECYRVIKNGGGTKDDMFECLSEKDKLEIIDKIIKDKEITFS